MRVNIPNALTISRIVLTFVFLHLFYQEGASSKIWALCVFMIASATDFFDGYIARKFNTKTSFGAIADPIADKFLTLSAFYVFACLEFYAFWMFVIIAIREIGLTLLRFWAMYKGSVIAADNLGKYKTCLQLLILVIMLGAVATYQMTFWNEARSASFQTFIHISMYLVVLLTVISGVTHLHQNRKAYFV